MIQHVRRSGRATRPTGLARQAIRPTTVALVLAALLPTTLHAHAGGGVAGGFLHGFAHPFAGIDHLLAMVAVGLWAAQRGGRALWALPATFVGTMLIGGAAGAGAASGAGAALGAAGSAIPGVEAGIATSVVVLGGLVALASRPRSAVVLAVVAAAALLHGHAHGAEMPAAASAGAYALGFAAATTMLHATGVFLALLAGTPAGTAWRASAGGPGIGAGGSRNAIRAASPAPRTAWIRAGGVAIAIGGVALLL